jgi:hypothetical protein
VPVSNPIVGGNTVVGCIKHRWRREHEFATGTSYLCHRTSKSSERSAENRDSPSIRACERFVWLITIICVGLRFAVGSEAGVFEITAE